MGGQMDSTVARGGGMAQAQITMLLSVSDSSSLQVPTSPQTQASNKTDFVQTITQVGRLPKRQKLFFAHKGYELSQEIM